MPASHDKSGPEDWLADLIRTADPETLARRLLPIARSVVAVILRGRDPHLIETAASDTVLAVWRYRRTFRGDARATTWLYRIAKRAAVRASRREAAHRAFLVPLEDDAVRRAVDARHRTEHRPLVRGAALRRLALLVPNPDWRRIWLLHGDPALRLTDREIAEITGYTKGSVTAIRSKVVGLIRRAVREGSLVNLEDLRVLSIEW